MGQCAFKEDKQQACIKQLNKISNELLKARKTMFGFLNATEKIEQKLEKIDVKADMQLIQKQMEQYEGQYDYQSFINSFDIFTQLIQRSKYLVEAALKNENTLKNSKAKNLIDSLNQYLSIFVLETCDDCEAEEGVAAAGAESPENQVSPIQPFQEYPRSYCQQNETLSKLPKDFGGQQSAGEVQNIYNTNQYLNPRVNSKSLGIANTTCNLKDDQTISSLRKRGASTKTCGRQSQNMEFPQIDLADYSKNSSIINRQRMPSRQKSYTVFVIDGQIKIQQQLSRIDLITSDSQIG